MIEFWKLRKHSYLIAKYLIFGIFVFDITIVGKKVEYFKKFKNICDTFKLD